MSIPLEDLRSADGLLEQRDSVVLPAGGPGDLDSVSAGTPVLLMASDPSGEQVPAATWRAELVGRLPHAADEPYPEGLPPTWLERHPPPAGSDPQTSVGGIFGAGAAPEDDDDEEEEGEKPIGPQSFFEVTSLRELPKHEWLFVNELVGKQARGGRTFFPRVPIAVRFPD